MEKDEIPKVKSATLTASYSLPLEPDVKDRLVRLKTEDKIDVNAWIRVLIKRGLEEIGA